MAGKKGVLPKVSDAGDDEVQALSALRQRIAAAIDDPELSARDLAPLTRRFQEVADALREATALAEDAKRVAEAEGKVGGSDSFDPESL